MEDRLAECSKQNLENINLKYTLMGMERSSTSEPNEDDFDVDFEKQKALIDSYDREIKIWQDKY